MRAAIIVFPGTNREADAAKALALAGCHDYRFVDSSDTSLDNYDLVILPGGFSYGDYLRCGAIAAQQPIMHKVREFAAKGGYVLGLCNGFQILCEARLLPGCLLRNKALRFTCRRQYFRIEENNSPFTSHYQTGEIIAIPMANGEGSYRCDHDTLRRLQGDGLIALRYCNEAGQVAENYDPTGSVEQIAGIFSKNRRVFGLMPHPENAIEDGQSNAGLKLFQSIAAAYA